MDIAVVDDEKAIREYICGLVEEQQPGSSIEAHVTGEGLLALGKRITRKWRRAKCLILS